MNRIVRIIERREVFKRFIFRIEEIKLQHEFFDGSMGPEITRLVLQRGDSVALLLFDTASQSVILCEQFRAPTCEHDSGWLIELPAGVLESGEDPQECARREAMEETGYAVNTLESIACVYLSPGGSSERISIFYCEVSMADRMGSGGGVLSEGEDIRLVSMPAAEAITQAKSGEIKDAKTLIGLQWLELRSIRHRN